MQNNAVQGIAVHFSAVRCSAVQYSTVQYSTKQHNTTHSQHNTIRTIQITLFSIVTNYIIHFLHAFQAVTGERKQNNIYCG
jgi:hypothetical protein